MNIQGCRLFKTLEVSFIILRKQRNYCDYEIYAYNALKAPYFSKRNSCREAQENNVKFHIIWS